MRCVIFTIFSFVVVALFLFACDPDEPSLDGISQFKGSNSSNSGADASNEGETDTGEGSSQECHKIIAESSEDGKLDLTGTWAEYYVATTQESIPVLGKQDGGSFNWFLHKITQNGATFSSTFNQCKLIIAQVGSTKTVPSDTMVENLGDFGYTGEIGLLSIPTSYVPTDVASLWGIRNMENKLEDPVPTDKNDPRVYDQDKDGHPGVTMHVSSIVSGDLYIVQRSIEHRVGVVTSLNRITGRVTEESQQEIMGATKNGLVQDIETIPHPDSERSYFIMVRVNDDCTCPALAKLGEEFFL